MRIKERSFYWCPFHGYPWPPSAGTAGTLKTREDDWRGGASGSVMDDDSGHGSIAHGPEHWTRGGPSEGKLARHDKSGVFWFLRFLDYVGLFGHVVLWVYLLNYTEDARRRETGMQEVEEEESATAEKEDDELAAVTEEDEGTAAPISDRRAPSAGVGVATPRHESTQLAEINKATASKRKSKTTNGRKSSNTYPPPDPDKALELHQLTKKYGSVWIVKVSGSGRF